MQNQASSAIKNLTPPTPPLFRPKRRNRGGKGGVISRFKNIFYICLFASIVVLFFSFVGFLLPIFREAVFFIILATVLILSFYRFEYGLYAALIELILGSKGYLFYFDFGGFSLSLRIGIFLVVFSVFLAKLILKKIEIVWSGKLAWFISFFAAIFIGFAQGFFRGFGFQNVFLDANGYFYLLYLFPFLVVFQNKEKFKKLEDILLSSGLVVAIFSLFLFYIFSHELFNSDLIYGWLRNNLLFEITYTGSVFRIFAQSQIFLLVVFFLSLSQLLEKKNFYPPTNSVGKKSNIETVSRKAASPSVKTIFGNLGDGIGGGVYLVIIISFFSLMGILVSLSRSFFVGLLAGLFVFCIIFYLKQKEIELPMEVQSRSVKKEFFKIVLVVILIFTASVGFLWTIEPQEPYALVDRVVSVKPSAEPASFTRQEELKPMLLEIIKKPFLGWGFGKTVEFMTRDPRALTMLPQCVGKESCLYTTYAFEWGYLDLWLKLGLFGLVSLFGILYTLFRKGWRELKKGGWILSSLAAVVVTNIFSPYLNHPLGLGILIILTIEVLYLSKAE